MKKTEQERTKKIVKNEAIAKNTRQELTQKIVYSAMFLAIGLILPFFTGQIPQIGSMLLPMHIPVLVCGMVCGAGYGGLVGFILPLMRYVLFGMPVIFPMGVSMAFELATYGVIVGRLYYRSKWKCWHNLYFSLITAMIGGRIAWGIVFGIFSGIIGQTFTLKIFLTSTIINGIPGILLQLLFVPMLVKAILRADIVVKERRAIGRG